MLKCQIQSVLWILEVWILFCLYHFKIKTVLLRRCSEKCKKRNENHCPIMWHMLYDAKEIAFKIVPSNHFFWDCAVPKVHNNLLQDTIFCLQKSVYLQKYLLQCMVYTGCYLGADMGCYLRVDSHSYGKISPQLLKERPHNLTKWTFLGTFTRHFAILRWKIGGKKSGATNECVFADFWQA